MYLRRCICRTNVPALVSGGALYIRKCLMGGGRGYDIVWRYFFEFVGIFQNFTENIANIYTFDENRPLGSDPRMPLRQ